jgi:signal transduction histidine kinase
MSQHSRGSSGVKGPTDINALCDEYLRLSYHGLRAKDKSFNAKFETDFDASLPKINVVPQDIGRVVLNLINNAFHACTERSRSAVNVKTQDLASLQFEPTVTVSTKHLSPAGGGQGELSPFGGGKGEVVISVKDNGPGIPDHIKEKIFQPFFTTKPTGKGTGLGLSLSYDIVKAHGGELVVESTVAEGLPAEASAQAGSEFIIHLPLGD